MRCWSSGQQQQQQREDISALWGHIIMSTSSPRFGTKGGRRVRQSRSNVFLPRVKAISMILLLSLSLTVAFGGRVVFVFAEEESSTTRADGHVTTTTKMVISPEDPAAKTTLPHWTTTKEDDVETTEQRQRDRNSKGNDRVVVVVNDDNGIDNEETKKNEYERLKTRFIDAKNVPIWDTPTESSLTKSFVGVQKKSAEETAAAYGEEQKFFIGNAMKMATKEKDVDAVISSYLTKKRREGEKSMDSKRRTTTTTALRRNNERLLVEEEQRLGVPGLMETLIGKRRETEVERKSRFPEHVFGATRNVEKNQKARDGWELTFSDEFDLDYLDLEKWTPRNGAPTSRRSVFGGVFGKPSVDNANELNAMSRLGTSNKSHNSSGGGSSRSGESSNSSGGQKRRNGQKSRASTSGRGSSSSFLGAQEEETVDKETWFHERNCKVIDGALVIASRKTVGKYDKPKNFDDDYDDNGVFLDIPGAQKFSESEFPFESCYIDSSKAFSQVYGRYEVRARLPGLSYDPDDKDTCAGVFPRIELLPDPDKTVPKDACWPRGGDIRVAQAFGQGRGGPGAKIGAVESGFHFMPSGATCGADGYVVDRTRPFELINQVEKSEYSSTNSSLSSSGTTSSQLGEDEKIKFNADWAREFHVFAVEWDKESLRFFIDDIFTHEINAYSAPMIPRWPFFVGIGTSVSPYGVLEALKNCEQDDQFAIIDYVRVYSKKSPHEVINNEVYLFWLFAVIVFPTLATMYCSAKYLIRQVIREDLFGDDEKDAANFGDGSSKGVGGNSLESGGNGDSHLSMSGKAKGVAFESLTDEKRRRRRLLRKLKREMGVVDSITIGTTEPLLTKILHEKEDIARARVERVFENEDAMNNAIAEGMENDSYRKYSKKSRSQKETKNVGGVTLRLPDITPKRGGTQSTYFSETSDFTTEAEGTGSGENCCRSSGGVSSDSGNQRQYGSGEL